MIKKGTAPRGASSCRVLFYHLTFERNLKHMCSKEAKEVEVDKV